MPWDTEKDRKDGRNKSTNNVMVRRDTDGLLGRILGKHCLLNGNSARRPYCDHRPI